MSNKLDKLAKTIRSTMKEADAKNPIPYDTPATVLSKEGDTLWVHIPGGVDRTPVRRTVDADEGDQVMVRVADGRAWTIGNATNPPTDGRVAIKALQLSVKNGKAVSNLNEFVNENSRIVNADIENVKIKNVEMENVMAQNARITNSFIDGLTAVDSEIRNSKIEGFTVIDGVVQGLQADRADIYGRLTASEAVIESLDATYATIDELEANYAHITQGVIDNAKIGYADVNDLNTHYAGIDLANVTNGWIENGVIKNGAIGDAQISSVSANKLTAGTIDASNITVTNLNADNITTGTINGQRIGSESITLDKLAEEVPTKEYLDNVAENLQGQIDGQIETWTGSVVPTLQNSPATNWGNASERHKHVGDIYYVVNASSEADGYTYRFTETGSSPNYTYGWTLIKDNQITKALQDILDMQGDITGIKAFDTQISSWKTDTDAELSSLKGRTSTLETDMGTKVSTTTFNELSQTVDENSASITSLSTTVQSKADSSTVTTLSNTVNNISQTATSNSSKISNLTTVLGTNADGTTKADDIMHRMSEAEQDLDGFKTTVSQTYQTKNAMSDYSTTSQMNTAIQQSASGITSTVAATYATKTYAEDQASTAESNAKSYADDNFDAIGSASAAQSAAEATAAADATAKANAARDAAIEDATIKLTGHYATSSTAIDTSAKTATIIPTSNSWALYSGATIAVKFINANTASTPTLNVNGTGAKAIRNYSGTALSSDEYKWPAGALMSFVYDGTYWRVQDSNTLIRLSSAETSIAQQADEIALRATKTEVDTLSGRVSTAESTITQHAADISAKVSKDGVIAAINLSSETEGGSTAKISANKVNIEGAAIFTDSGRLSQTSLDNAYDANGAASNAVGALTTDLASSTGTTVIDGGHITTNSITIGQVANLQSSLDGKATPSDVATAKSEAISAAETDATNKANDAAKTATSYITDIDSNKGITLKPADSTGNDYLMMNSNAIAFYRNSSTNSCVNLTDDTFRIGLLASGHSTVKSDGLHVWTGAESTATNEVAKFGAESRIGASNDRHVEIKSGGMQVYNASSVIFHVGYGSAQGTSGMSLGSYITFGTRKSGSAVGHLSVAIGEDVISDYYVTAAFGGETKASDTYDFACGYKTKADGGAAFVCGEESQVTGRASFASGYQCLAQNDWATATGWGTTTNSYAQTVVGMYNKLSSSAMFIVGNGGGTSNRSNAFEINYNGTAYIGGTTTIDGLIKTVSNGKTTTIGSQNAYYCHIYTDADEFAINKSIAMVDNGSLGNSSYPAGGLYLLNNYWIHAANSSKTQRLLCGINSDNGYFFGYGGYNNSEGSSYFDGNNVYIRSKHSVSINSSTSISGNLTVSGFLKADGTTTTTNSANMWYGNGSTSLTVGRIYYNANSSRKWKHDIKDISNADLSPKRLYNAKVRQFKYDVGYLDKDDLRNNVDVPGFIAEELHEVYPIATDMDVTGKPVNWNAQYLIPPMLALIQEQHKEIESLKVDVDNLKGAIQCS